MKKALITLIILSLIIVPIYANPRPSNSPKLIIGIFSVVTLGLGYILFKAFTNDDVVEFKDEEIDIKINENNSVDVTGIYNFKRTGKSVKTFKIIYPFPNQNEFGKVEIESVKINGEEVKYHKFNLTRRNQISLNLNFTDDDKCELFISFKQKPNNSSYKYILKSTKKWKKELEKSIIKVILPASYQFESNYNDFEEKESEYKMTKHNFYPDKDLFINWK